MENESEIGHNSHFFHFTAFRRNIQEAFKKIKEISQKFLKSSVSSGNGSFLQKVEGVGELFLTHSGDAARSPPPGRRSFLSARPCAFPGVGGILGKAPLQKSQCTLSANGLTACFAVLPPPRASLSGPVTNGNGFMLVRGSAIRLEP